MDEAMRMAMREVLGVDDPDHCRQIAARLGLPGGYRCPLRDEAVKSLLLDETPGWED